MIWARCVQWNRNARQWSTQEQLLGCYVAGNACFCTLNWVRKAPRRSPICPQVSFKMQCWTTWAQIFGAKTRPWPPIVVSFTIGKLMIPRFDHNVCNETAMQGIGAHRNGSLATLNWVRKGPTRWILMPSKAPPDQSDLRFRCQNEVMTTNNC